MATWRGVVIVLDNWLVDKNGSRTWVLVDRMVPEPRCWLTGWFFRGQPQFMLSFQRVEWTCQANLRIGLAWCGLGFSTQPGTTNPDRLRAANFRGPQSPVILGATWIASCVFLSFFFLHEVYPKQPAAVTEKKAIAAWRSRRFRGRLSAVWAQGFELKGIRYEPLFDYFKGKACASRRSFPCARACARVFSRHFWGDGDGIKKLPALWSLLFGPMLVFRSGPLKKGSEKEDQGFGGTPAKKGRTCPPWAGLTCPLSAPRG